MWMRGEEEVILEVSLFPFVRDKLKGGKIFELLRQEPVTLFFLFTGNYEYDYADVAHFSAPSFGNVYLRT